MKKSIASLCFLALLLVTGCATLFKGTNETINTQSSPVQPAWYHLDQKNIDAVLVAQQP